MKIEAISDRIDNQFSVKSKAREKVLVLSRRVIQHSGKSIRAIHRGENSEAEKLLKEARADLDQCEEFLKQHPDIYYGGYLQDAQKEYAEAMATYSLILNKSLPDPDVLRVGYASYANGLGETIGELRRHILDLIRQGKPEAAEEFLGFMDDIFYLLASLDYPDAITGKLRRTADIARAIMEKTRGDLTNALRQRELMHALEDAKKKL